MLNLVWKFESKKKNVILKKQLNYNALMSYNNNLFYIFAKRKKYIFHVNGAILMRITVAVKAISRWKNLLPFESCIIKNVHQFFTDLKKIKLKCDFVIDFEPFFIFDFMKQNLHIKASLPLLVISLVKRSGLFGGKTPRSFRIYNLSLNMTQYNFKPHFFHTRIPF